METPMAHFVATSTMGMVVTLLRNGTVRDERGLTSMTYTLLSRTMYCTLIIPLTSSSKAIFTV